MKQINEDKQRNLMRLALGKRLKQDLIDSEETKLLKIQTNNFIVLDKQLIQVEELRNNNKKRELILIENLNKQTNLIAKNISASKIKD